MMQMSEREIAEMNVYETKSIALSEKAKEINIVTPEDLAEASKLLKECNLLSKTVDKERKKITDPMNTWITGLIAKAKDVLLPAVEAKELVKAKILEYNKKLEEMRIKEQERIRKEQDELRLKEEQEQKKRDEEEAKKQQEEKKKLSGEITPEEKKKIENDRVMREFNEEKMRTKALEEKIARENEAKIRESAIAANISAAKPKGMRTRWKFEVIDANLVPRAFCKPDDSVIAEAVKNGAREIEGLRIYSEESVQ